jgi:hypothetical protein
MEESRKEFTDRMLEKELAAVPEGDHPNPDVRVWQHASAQATARGERLGRLPPPDLSDAHMVGEKDQDRNDLSNFEDVARLMETYQTNLNRLLTRMQQTLLEAIHNIEVLESHWQRLH